MLPDNSVEAAAPFHLPEDAIDAAKAVFNGKPPRGMRAALAAAAPYLMAHGWDEGVAYVFEGGAEVSDENPYRKARK
jgi:hypothetical protein